MSFDKKMDAQDNKELWEEGEQFAKQSEEKKSSLMEKILSKGISELSDKDKDGDNEIVHKHDYVSKDGFVKRNVVRGFTEIKNVYNLIHLNNINSFICGGYVRYMVSNQPNPVPAGDLDIYSYDLESFNKLKELFTKTHGLKIRHENEMAITLTRSEEGLFCASPPIQLIKPIDQGSIKAVGTMEHILKNFDFTVIRCGLISENEAMVDADFENDEAKRFLRIKNIHCPISSTFRIIKYCGKGYWINTFGVLGLFLDWDGRDDSYKEKLVDFLRKVEESGLTQKELDELESLMRID